MISKLKKLSLIFSVTILIFGVGNVWAEDDWPLINRDRECIGEISVRGLELGVYLFEGDWAKKQVASFNQSMHKRMYLGTITYCRRVIDIPAGTVDGDHSYGGLCLLEGKHKEPERVMVCNDVLANHFKMVPLESPKDNVLDLSKFVVENCTGG